MSWRLAKSLVRLREQVNRAYPNRNKASDGSIGDAAHQKVSSDHNPNAEGVVCALDLTNSPDNGFDVHDLFDRLLVNRHPDLKYLISNRRIAGDWTGWKWGPYEGKDPHINHGHTSVGIGPDGKSKPPYDDANDWAVNAEQPSTPPILTPVQSQTVTLPASVQTWAAYRVGSAYRKGTSDQVGTLLPSKFGGLTYRVIDNRGNVVVVDTQSFGRVAIWVQGTSAVLGGGQAPSSPAAGGNTVTFPRHVESWAVYKVDSGYRKGTNDQVGTLRPAKFGGLTYPIVERRDNVVVIDTQNFGRVAAWVKDTDAVLK
jgi:hypothetical protein